ncbi:MAG TPA: peptide-methionine (S)-S-oxide reductase MsrA [Bryobacteraceae bacterium]|nr:peptide-methionine (S)-S-oxide reductase MsrA [Bryobacteraceae bacterium]
MSRKHFAFVPLVLALVSAACLTAGTSNFPQPAVDIPTASEEGLQKAVLAGGCFWGMEGLFERINGVKKVVSGFAGGKKSTAHYEEVSTGTTGHAESVEITFDPKQITYGQLLMIYFSVGHDPTELNRQGPDSGSQYRSVIFYTNDQQKKVAEAYIKQLEAAKVFHGPIVTQVVPLQGFYPAEAYHQHFLDNNMTYPYIVYNDLPKLAALKKEYPEFCKRH